MLPITILFFDEILPGDAAQVVAQLQAAPKAPVEVRVNSPGGSVAEGLAIYNALKPRAPTVFIDGVAASIASLIAMAGAHIIAAENAIVMVHAPWSGVEGNATALRKTADLLDLHRGAMLGAYARTGLSQQSLIELLEAETWMTAQQALALGFVDEIAEPLAFAAHAPACFSGYKHPPKELVMPNALPANNLPAVDAAGAAARASASTQPAQAAQPDAAASTNAPVVNAQVLNMVHQRNENILAISRPYIHHTSINSYMLAALADPRIGLEDFRAQVMDLLGREAAPANGSGGRVECGIAVGDFVAAVSDALAMRAGIKIAQPHPGVRDVQGMGLTDIMRACVGRSGRALEFGSQAKGAIVRAAMSTSDFPAILENTLGKTLRAGFEAEPFTADAWASKTTVPDFKPQSRVILGSAPDLLLVPEGGEYTQGSMDDDKSVPYSAGKFGRLVNFTWESLINDDLGAFLRITQAMGQAASRAEADAIYATFAENSGAGPTMQDSVALFNSAHGNLATSAAALTADALSSARVLLRRQTAVGGGAMNLTPRYLLVAPEQEQAAETLLAAASRNLSQGSDIALVPSWLSQLQLVVEARLTGSAFYLLTSPTSVDTLERAWLEADDGPVIVEQDSFAVDAKSYKVRHVFGSRWLDWRGAVKVPLS